MYIIDSHAHLMQDPFHYMDRMPVDDFIALLDDAGIQKTVLFTLTGLVRDFQLHNDELAGVVARHPDRLVGLGTVNPWYGDEAVQEAERCFTELGFSGLKFSPWYQGFLVNSSVMHPICELAEKHDKTLFIHTGTPPGSSPLQVGNLALAYPNVRIVMAHLGLPDLWWEAVVTAARHPNVYVETAGAHSLSIKRAVEILGTHKVLYGSDAPFGGRNNLFFQRDKILLLDLPDTDLERIMALNTAEVFKISL